MSDLHLIGEAAPDEAPIAWRVSWIRTAGYLPFHPVRPKPETMDCVSKEEADKAKAHLREMWPEAVITVTPVFPKARKMTKKALRQALDAAGWPLQMRVPR